VDGIRNGHGTYPYKNYRKNRMMKKFLFLVLSLLVSNVVLALPCYDLSKGEPSSLIGKLTYVVYPGPPNYESVQKGDTPKPTYVLELSSSICLDGDADFADPKISFSKVHLVATKETLGKLKSFVNKNITVMLKDPMAAHTGHHHQPLVAWVTSLQLYTEKPKASRSLDFIDEYGTAATTIRAFYSALADGQGEIASSYIVPEKRSIPAFNGANMTRFYGGLVKPVSLINIVQNDPEIFTVKYTYGTKSKVCDGLATVTTAVRDGRNFILSIKPLNGC